MPLYLYRALDAQGRTIRGQLNANNDQDLYQRLREIGLELVQGSPAGQRRGLSFLAAKIRTRDLVQMCVHLEQLNAAGVSLLEALADVRDSTDQPRLRDLTSEIHRDVSEGKSLSEAFGRHPRVFGTVFTALLSAGEESGNLTESFRQLSKHLRWTESVTQKVKKATRYPMVMLAVIMALFMFMMIFVVPGVVDFLISTGKELPAVTVALVATSDFVVAFWYLILLAPVVIWMSMVALRKASRRAAYHIDYYILRLPGAGNLVRKIQLARFAHFFAVMFQSGVPILQCLETAQKVITNLCLYDSLQFVRKTVQEGNPLSYGLKQTGEFPNLVIRMVKIGEDSGNLTDTLENVTDFYDHDVNEAVDALIQMLEPALTAVAGGIMVWIVIAVIGPIYDSFSALGG